MKRLLLLPLVALLISSCSQDIEDNTPGMQAVIDDVLYRAIDARASYTDDGALLIQGTTDIESLNLLFRSTTGPQGFGSCCSNVAAFEDVDGNLYSTAPNGEGFSRMTVRNGTVSGTFNFVAMRNGNRDTLTFSKGFVYRVPILEDPLDDPEPDAVADSFTARVNTVSFNPTVIASAASGGQLAVSGQSSNVIVAINFPSNTGPGTYTIADSGSITASYTASGATTVAQTGSLTIISNDTTAKVVKGQFTFQAGAFAVTDGAFTINY